VSIVIKTDFADQLGSSKSTIHETKKAVKGCGLREHCTGNSCSCRYSHVCQKRLIFVLTIILKQISLFFAD
jgi:hypothetical protein